jgi:hypothetical protein
MWSDRYYLFDFYKLSPSIGTFVLLFPYFCTIVPKRAGKECQGRAICFAKKIWWQILAIDVNCNVTLP